jgi:hypothetical protein
LCVAGCQDWCHPSLCRPDLSRTLSLAE